MQTQGFAEPTRMRLLRSHSRRRSRIESYQLRQQRHPYRKRVRSSIDRPGTEGADQVIGRQVCRRLRAGGSLPRLWHTSATVIPPPDSVAASCEPLHDGFRAPSGPLHALREGGSAAHRISSQMDQLRGRPPNVDGFSGSSSKKTAPVQAVPSPSRTSSAIAHSTSSRPPLHATAACRENSFMPPSIPHHAKSPRF